MAISHFSGFFKGHGVLVCWRLECNRKSVGWIHSRKIIYVSSNKQKLTFWIKHHINERREVIVLNWRHTYNKEQQQKRSDKSPTITPPGTQAIQGRSTPSRSHHHKIMFPSSKHARWSYGRCTRLWRLRPHKTITPSAYTPGLDCTATYIPADLLPRWQKVRQSRATQPRCTDVPDWVTTSAVQPTFWDSDSFHFKCHGRHLAPNRCNVGGGSVWDVVVQPGPGWLTVGDSSRCCSVPCHVNRAPVILCLLILQKRSRKGRM